jgi:hypothetical protein
VNYNSRVILGAFQRFKKHLDHTEGGVSLDGLSRVAMIILISHFIDGEFVHVVFMGYLGSFREG